MKRRHGPLLAACPRIGSAFVVSVLVTEGEEAPFTAFGPCSVQALFYGATTLTNEGIINWVGFHNTLIVKELLGYWCSWL